MTLVPSPMSGELSLVDELVAFSFGEYNLAVTTTLLLWDILITFRREKLYIWSYHSRANWTTLFYLITRYVPFIVNAACLILLLQFELFRIPGTLGFFRAVGSSGQFTEIFRVLYTVPWFVVLNCTDILFIRRVVALHGGSRLLSRILIGFLVCELISAIVAFFLSTPRLCCRGILSTGSPTPFGAYVFSRTSPLALPSSGTYFTFPELVFQAFLVMLIMKMVISDWRGIARCSLMSVVVRDGLWSYFCNLCGLLVIVIQPPWLNAPVGLPNILWSYASFSITSTRLILNLRAAAAKQSGANNISTVGTRLTFLQGVRSFLTPAPENDEFSTPYHYHDFGHDSDSDSDD